MIIKKLEIKKIKWIFLLILICSVVSINCNKFDLNINETPNAVLASKATPFLLFPAATMSTVATVGGGLSLVGGLLGQFWTQSHLANQYKIFCEFNITTANLSGVFSELYAGGLTDYKKIIEYAEKNKDYKYYRESQVLKTYTYALLTDLYDSIPFEESLQGAANMTPVSNSGYNIYLNLIAKLDSVFSVDYSSVKYSDAEKKADLIFGGDTLSWRKFYNTLKLKMLLRLVNKYPAIADQNIRSFLATNPAFLDVNAGISTFADIISGSNPLYESNIRKQTVKTNLQPCYTFGSWLILKGDVRASKFVSSATLYHYGGHNTPTGQKLGGTTYPISVNNVVTMNATDPVYLITTAESYFLQSEAAARYGINVSGKADSALYRLGVTAAYTQWGNTAAEAATALGAAYAYPTTTLEEKIKAIIMQKRITLYKVNTIETFIDQQRTGYPEYSPVYSALDANSVNPAYVPGQLVSPPTNYLGANKFVLRFPYPSSEIIANNKASTKPLTTPLWFVKIQSN